MRSCGYTSRWPHMWVWLGVFVLKELNVALSIALWSASFLQQACDGKRSKRFRKVLQTAGISLRTLLSEPERPLGRPLCHVRQLGWGRAINSIGHQLLEQVTGYVCVLANCTNRCGFHLSDCSVVLTTWLSNNTYRNHWEIFVYKKKKQRL